MYQKSIITLCLIICLCLPGCLSVNNAPNHITDSSEIIFLHFNDFYEIEGHNGKGGLLSLSQMIEQQKQVYPDALITFGGDLLSPSLYSSVTKGEHMIEALALLNVDIAVPGNHEFDFGLENAVTQFQASQFPWVISNLNSHDNSLQNATVQTYIREVNGWKIGFFGLITPELAYLSQHKSQINLPDFIDTAQKMVKLLKQQEVDLIVAMTHLTLTEDQQLAEQVKDIDLILGGHDHFPVNLLINNTLIFKSGNNGEHLGIIKAQMDKSESKRPSLSGQLFSKQVLSTPEQTKNLENKRIRQFLSQYQQRLAQEKSRHLAVSLIPLDATTMNLRSTESSFGNLVSDALRQHYKADIALINGGAIRSDKIYPANSALSQRDILFALPFANRSVLVKLSGQQILDILEHGVSAVEDYSGRFPQISGLSIELSPQFNPGQRIGNVMIGSEPIKREKTYTMATTDYLFQGGDGYEQFQQTEALIGTEQGELLSNIVADYLDKLKQLRSIKMGRVKFNDKSN